MYFFFFQAEDGIRDTSVTGVQTCALPISIAVPTAAGEPRQITPGAWDAEYPTWMPDGREILFSARGGLWRLAVAGDKPGRSEERRVGKECRSREWRTHGKDNENTIGAEMV